MFSSGLLKNLFRQKLYITNMRHLWLAHTTIDSILRPISTVMGNENSDIG